MSVNQYLVYGSDDSIWYHRYIKLKSRFYYARAISKKDSVKMLW